jgi:valyl-tRNA synthetase
VLICPDAGKMELLHSFSGSICAMTRAESVEIVESGAVPDDAAHSLVCGIEVVVPLKELIDVDAELDKLARERKTLEQDLQRVRGKLGKKMPSSTSRGSRGLRPRVSFLQADCEMTGSILIHCLSVSSMLQY